MIFTIVAILENFGFSNRQHILEYRREIAPTTKEPKYEIFLSHWNCMAIAQNQ